MAVPTVPTPGPEPLRALLALELARAERDWRALRSASHEEPDTWTLGVTLAGWRGDAAAAREREAEGRRALSSGARDGLARHRLALAAGEAALRCDDLRAALPLLGEALGQTERHPGHPAAVDALLALAGLHALYAAPRKARALLERALARQRELGAATAGARERRWRARWVALVADVRLGQRSRPAAARRAERLALAWRCAGHLPEALQLEADAALLRAVHEGEALGAADARGLGGVRGRSALLRRALRGIP
jgi:hypothetical protein